MSRRKKNNSSRLNKMLLITGIIFVVSGVIALTTILNKGVIFEKRLVPLTGGTVVEEPEHVIQVVSDTNYLTEVGETLELTITIDGKEPELGVDYELTSSDESIVKIEGNTVTAVSLGDAVITAKSTEFDVEGTLTLSVVVPVNKLTLSAEFDEIKIGETSQISHTTKPTEATGAQVRLDYKSSDNSIATVDNSGIVTGKGIGIATITATDKITGLSDTYDIVVVSE